MAQKTRAKAPETPTPETNLPEQKLTKIATLTGMMKRETGVCLEELGKATGWQAHTIRAAITRLRQKGHQIERKRINEATHYAIVGSPEE